MAWKIEKWLSEVFPGEENIYSEYRTLSGRELAIVSAAVLDIALVELLSLRLENYEKESEQFLGLNGDGSSPVGSFGARIQLGLLVGILTENDAKILRAIKEIRNLFAHKVGVNFLEPSVLKATTKLCELWRSRTESLISIGALNGTTKSISTISEWLPKESAAGEGLLLAVLSVYQAYFHRMHGRILRVGNAI